MSRLLKNSEEYRKINIARNSYDRNDEYGIGHPNALSDGDELGKGENDGSVGGLTDIKKRENLSTKNQYNRNREYNAGTV